MMGAVVGPKTQLANVLKVDLTEIPKSRTEKEAE
jgi:hypothetical protein